MENLAGRGRWGSKGDEAVPDVLNRRPSRGVSVNDGAVRSIAQQINLHEVPLLPRSSSLGTARIQFLKIKVLDTLVK